MHPPIDILAIACIAALGLIWLMIVLDNGRPRRMPRQMIPLRSRATVAPRSQRSVH